MCTNTNKHGDQTRALVISKYLGLLQFRACHLRSRVSTTKYLPAIMLLVFMVILSISYLIYIFVFFQGDMLYLTKRRSFIVEKQCNKLSSVATFIYQ